MSSTPIPEPPDVLYGLLAAGERTTRRFSGPCPETHLALLQAKAGVRIVEQSAEDITIENGTPVPAMFIVLFATKEFVKAAIDAKSLLGYLYDRFGGRGKR